MYSFERFGARSNQGRLKFGDKAKPQMKIDSDPLQAEEANLVEPVEALVVEINNMNLVETTEVMMVEFDDDLDPKAREVTEWDYDQKVEEVYPKSGEDLVDFLHRCKIEDSEVMLCPRCSAVFDMKAAKSLEEVKVQVPKKKPLVDERPKFSFNKSQFGDYDAKFQRQATGVENLIFLMLRFLLESG